MIGRQFHKTLVLSQADVRRHLPLKELVDGVRAAYVAYAGARDVRPQRAVGRVGTSSIVVNFPGELPGYNTYTIKVNAKTASNLRIGLPFLIGTILLLDRTTGVPLAILESSLITAMRTAAAGVVGVQTLARPGANKVALVGAGAQGAWQLRALHAAGRLSTARLYDVVPERADELAARLTDELQAPSGRVRRSTKPSRSPTSS